jgi:murein DD-endopeptidase MepM/ murein hydrolase activator NlpD
VATTVASVAFLGLAGCSGTHQQAGGIYHPVARGENLYRIGKAYGVSHVQLAKVNAIDNPNRVEIGQKVFVPGAKRLLPVNVITPERVLSEVPIGLPRGEGVFIWPLESGNVSSPFGYRSRHYHHDGIDISAPVGSTVRAARDGSVVYSDTLRGYGNVIIIQHVSGFATVYAHNSANLVRPGERVRQGQTIARVGDTGRTTGPNLHFEIRKDNGVVNPVYFLPRETAQRAKDGPT